MRGYLNRVRREINRGKSLRVKPQPLRAIEG